MSVPREHRPQPGGDRVESLILRMNAGHMRNPRVDSDDAVAWAAAEQQLAELSKLLDYAWMHDDPVAITVGSYTYVLTAPAPRFTIEYPE